MKDASFTPTSRYGQSGIPIWLFESTTDAPCSTAKRGVVKSPNWAKKGGLRLYGTRGQKQCPRAGCLHLTVKGNSGASKGRVVEGDRLT
jgi:hypothetical protein